MKEKERKRGGERKAPSRGWEQNYRVTHGCRGGSYVGGDFFSLNRNEKKYINFKHMQRFRSAHTINFISPNRCLT